MATTEITPDLPEGFVLEETNPLPVSSASDLPSGFVIESGTQASPSDLPEGFVLEAPAEKQSFGRNIVQRMARSVDEGIGLMLQGVGRADQAGASLFPKTNLRPASSSPEAMISFGKKLQEGSKDYAIDDSRDKDFDSKLASAIGSSLPMLAGSFSVPTAVAGNMATMAESFRQSALEEGGTEDDANKAFMVGGTVGAASEYFLGTLGRIAKGIIGAGIRQTISKEAKDVLVRNTIEKLGPWTSTALGKVGLSYAREFTQEGAEQLAQNISDLSLGDWKGRTDEKKDKLFSDVWDSAFYGGFVGAATNVLEQGVEDVNLNRLAKAQLDGKEEFVSRLKEIHEGIDSDEAATPEQKEEAKKAALTQFPPEAQAYFESRKDGAPLEEGTEEYKKALRSAKQDMLVAVEETGRKEKEKKAQDIGPETLRATLEANAAEKIAQAEAILDTPAPEGQSGITDGEVTNGTEAEPGPGGESLGGGNEVRVASGQEIAGDSASLLSKEGVLSADELENQTNWGQLSADVQESLDNIQNSENDQPITDSWVNHFVNIGSSLLRSRGVNFGQVPSVPDENGNPVKDLSSPQFLHLQAQVFDEIQKLSDKARASKKPLPFQVSIGGESITHVGKNEVVKVIKPGREGFQATIPEINEDGSAVVHLTDGDKKSLQQKVDAMNSLPGMVPVKLARSDRGGSVMIQRKVSGRNATDSEITNWAKKNGAVEVNKAEGSSERRAFAMRDSQGSPWLVLDIGDDNIQTEKNGETVVIDPVVSPLSEEDAAKLGLQEKPNEQAQAEAPATKEAPQARKPSENKPPSSKSDGTVAGELPSDAKPLSKSASKAVRDGRIYGVKVKNAAMISDLDPQVSDRLFDSMKVIAPLLKKFGIDSLTMSDEGGRMYQRGREIFLNPHQLSNAVEILSSKGVDATEVTRLTAHEEVAHLLHDIVEQESGVTHQRGYESMSEKDREETAKLYDLNSRNKLAAQWLSKVENKNLPKKERDAARQLIFKEYVRQQVQLITEGATAETVAANLPNKKPGFFDDVLKTISRKWKAATGDAKSQHIEAVRALIKAREKLWAKRQKWSNEVRKDYSKIDALAAKDFRKALIGKSDEYLVALADRFALNDKPEKESAVLAELEFRQDQSVVAPRPTAEVSAAPVDLFEGEKEVAPPKKRKIIPVEDRVDVGPFLEEDSDNTVIPFLARILRSTTLYRRADGTIDEDALQEGIQDVSYAALRAQQKPDGMSYYDPKRGAPTTWINQIARSFISDELDRRFSLKRGEGVRPYSLEATPEDTSDVALENTTATTDANPEQSIRRIEQKSRYLDVKDQIDDIIEKMDLTPLQEDIILAKKNPGHFLGIPAKSYSLMSARELTQASEKKLLELHPEYTTGQIKMEYSTLMRQIAALINTTANDRIGTFSPSADIDPQGDPLTDEALRQYQFLKRQRENPYYGEIGLREKVDNIYPYFNRVSNAEEKAKALSTFDKEGVEKSMEMIQDPDSGLSESDRVSLGYAALEYWNQQIQAANESGDSLGAERAAEKTVTILQNLNDLAHNSGYALQLFRGRLTPEGWQRYAIKKFKDAQGVIKDVAQPVVDAVAKEYQRIKGQLSDALMQNDRLSKLLEKAQDKAESQNPDTEFESEIEALSDDELEVLLDYYERLEAEARKADKTQPAGDIDSRRAKIERLRILRKNNYSEEIRAKVKHPKVRKSVQKLLDPVKETEKAVKKALRSVRDVVFQTQAQQSLTVQELADRLVAESGLSGKDAEALAQAVVATANAEIAEKTKKFLDQMETRSKGEKKVVRALKSKTQKIMDFAVSGALSREAIYNAVADGLGLPSYNAEFINEVRARAEAIKDMPEDSNRQRQAILDLNNFIAKKLPLNAVELALSEQTASMLFNLGTGVVNAVSGFINPRISGLGLRAFNPERFKFMKGFYGEYLQQFYNGQGVEDARQILAGRVPYANKANLEGSGVLEIALQKYDDGDPVDIDVLGKKTLRINPNSLTGKFFLGKAGALRWLAYSGRILAATDAWNKAGPGMRYALVDAYNRAAKVVDPNDTVAFEQEVGRQMGVFDESGENLIDQMRQKVAEEGITDPREAQMRMVSLITANRGKDAMAAQEAYRDTETFNRAIPHGLAGLIKGGLDSVVAGSPIASAYLKFTRFSANFTNEMLNFAPIWSIKRLMLGSGLGLSGNKRFDKYRLPAPRGTDFEVQLTKVLVGHAVAGALLGIFDWWKDDEDPPILISGDGPNDKEQRKLLMATGWQPNTIKVGNTFIKYENLGALAVVFKTVGEISDAYRYEGNRDSDKMASALFTAPLLGASMILDMGIMKSVKDFIDTVYASRYSKTPGEDIGSNALKLAVNQASTFIPGYGMLKDLDNMMDRSIPDKTTVMSSLAASVPFVRRANRPALNIFGKPVERTMLQSTPGLRRLLSMEVPHDPVYDLMLKNDVTIRYQDTTRIYDPSMTVDGKKGGMRQLTEDEHYELVKLAGPIVYQGIKNLSNADKMDPKNFREIVSKMAAAAKKAALADLSQKLIKQ